MCTNRRKEGGRSPRNNMGRRSVETLLDPSEDDRGKGSASPSTPGSSLCGPKRSTLLCSAAEGGGETTASRAPVENGERDGVGTCTSDGRPPGGAEHYPTDSRSLPLARTRGRGESFCQACPTCQRTSPRTPPPSPLIPLPIIEVPFERIGMDLVGPLPKSARGHEHILVIVDYATRYPEAIPLRKATSKAIAQELFLLCSRVGIPSEILTDQGTPFMSRLMADLCRLLQVRQIKTTVYHPQTDGLVERFNQTLKQMLRRVAADDRRDWDKMLPYVLFGIREVPQASTGFTPFELLFGRQPRGLLDVAREAWEHQPAAHRSTLEHVRE